MNLKQSYPSRIIITDSPFNPKVLRGKTMRGQQILEVIVQNKPMAQRMIDYVNSNIFSLGKVISEYTINEWIRTFLSGTFVV